MKNEQNKEKNKAGLFGKIFGKSKRKVIEIKPDDMEQDIFGGADVTEEEAEALFQENIEAFHNEQLDDTFEKPKNIIEKEPVFVKNLDAKSYSDSLYTYLNDNGVMINMSDVRELFSGMALSKLIVLKSEDPLLSERVLSLFSDFIGANYYKNKVNSILGSFDDLFKEGYRFNKALESANNQPNRIHITSLSNVRLETVEQYFDKVIEYAWNPLLPCNITNEKFTTVKEMPVNNWFFVIPTKDSGDFASKEFARSAVTIELNAKVVTPKETVEQNESKLSYEFFNNFLLEGYENYYVDETEWKKLDKIVDYLQENSSFVFDNRLFRQLERFTSTYIMFGGDKFDAMDTVLFSKVLKAISLLEIKQDQNSESGLFQLFEKLFGLENLSKSKVLLKEIQQQSRKK